MKRILILGAAGRDFHNFNVVFRHNPEYQVAAFTAAQIPNIANRRYPPELAGPLYPDGIPILDEQDMERIIREREIDVVVFSYSDISHVNLMHLASRAVATGADFWLLGANHTQLKARVPVISVCAVRTGCGKSPVSRRVITELRALGWKPVVVRHPMPYGDLAEERVQRFASLADLDSGRCTAEEREEYEPHIAAGNLVFAGVDYAAILEAAESEAEVIVWDGGNNDFPLVRPDLHIVVADALRPDQIATHHPGETVARMADVAVVNKINAAPAADVVRAIEGLRRINPRAAILRAASLVQLDDPAAVRGRRVLVVEDGPTITHGGMPHGAGYAAATEAGAAEIVDPRTAATPAIREVYRAYPHIGPVLPAVGYSDAQLAALAATIDASAAEVVVVATPFDLGRLVHVEKPLVRARYEFAEAGEPTLGAVIDAFVARTRLARVRA